MKKPMTTADLFNEIKAILKNKNMLPISDYVFEAILEERKIRRVTLIRKLYPN